MRGRKKRIFAIVLGFLVFSCFGGCVTKQPEGNGQQAAGVNIADVSEGDMEEPLQNLSGNESGMPDLAENEMQDADMKPEGESVVYYTVEEVKALEIPEDKLAYWLVLNSKIPFISADEGCQEFFWDEYFWRLSEPVLRFTMSDFAIVDLDVDGVEELVMTGFMPETTWILDYQEGKVYSYQFVFRGMAGIGIDGVYSSSIASDMGGFHRIHLDKGSYEEETLAYMNGDYFEVDGAEVSSDEFYAYTASLTDTEKINGMDFMEEMLDEVLLGDFAEEASQIRNVAQEEICDENNPQMAEVPELYREVLTGNEGFVCVTENGETFFIDGSSVRNPAGEEQYQILYFSSADMDGDGENEVVLACSGGAAGENLILHEAEGVIYGYVFEFWNEMSVIANDGVFQEGTYRDQYGKISSFDENGCDIEEVDYNGNINDDRIRYYYFSEELIGR